MFAIRKVGISEQGIAADSQLGHAETNWNSYQQFGETNNLFLLYESKDLVVILPKRAFADQKDLENRQGTDRVQGPESVMARCASTNPPVPVLRSKRESTQVVLFSPSMSAPSTASATVTPILDRLTAD